MPMIIMRHHPVTLPLMLSRGDDILPLLSSRDIWMFSLPKRMMLCHDDVMRPPPRVMSCGDGVMLGCSRYRCYAVMILRSGLLSPELFLAV